VDPPEDHCAPRKCYAIKPDEKALFSINSNPDDHSLITEKKNAPACFVILDNEGRQRYKKNFERCGWHGWTWKRNESRRVCLEGG
jgi:hypothetical protein